MWLREIEADRLRNLKAVQLGLPAGLTLIVGGNGQGKTSLIEAIYLLGTGRSFRTRRQDELVCWDGGPLRVAGRVEGRLGLTDLSVVLDTGTRHLLVGGAERELTAYLGRLDVVDLTGERMNVLRGGPEDRRRFLDRGVVGLRPDFLLDLGEYRRVLQQRNALLRRPGSGSDPAELAAWDERLQIAAQRLHIERRRYAVQLASRLGEIGRALFPDGQELRLRYLPSPAAAGRADPDRFREILAESLHQSRSRDLMVGHTCVGPHRDDLQVELEQIDLRRFGSAGQVRAAMISLKLGKISLLAEERGEAPLFLMDDFDTDVDEVRAAAVADFLGRGRFQAVVASSKESLVDGLGATFMKLRMSEGVARAA